MQATNLHVLNGTSNKITNAVKEGWQGACMPYITLPSTILRCIQPIALVMPETLAECTVQAGVDRDCALHRINHTE
jgi:hypothetical protein